jgi:hypothetical protein
MAARITNEVLEVCLDCGHKGNLKLAGEHGIRSDYEALMAEHRAEVRLRAIDKILARPADLLGLVGVAAPCRLARPCGRVAAAPVRREVSRGRAARTRKLLLGLWPRRPATEEVGMKVVPGHSGLSTPGVPWCESRPPAGPDLLPGARASASERVLLQPSRPGGIPAARWKAAAVAPRWRGGAGPAGRRRGGDGEGRHPAGRYRGRTSASARIAGPT